MTPPGPTRHVLVLGGMRHLHKVLAGLPGIRTTVLAPARAIKAADLTRHGRVLGIGPGRDELLDVAAAVHRHDPFDHVVAFHDDSQAGAADVAGRLGLPYHAPETIEAVTDKSRMRDRLRAAGVETDIANLPALTAGQARRAADTLGYPAILKPARGSGSTAVARMDGPAGVADAWAEVRREYPDGPVLVEQFLAGPEFSVEAVSEAGVHRVVALTEKFKTDGYVEIGHLVPARTPHEDAIVAHVTASLTALGVLAGPTHTEVIVTPRGPRLVETHVRLGGDFIPEMVEDVTGVPFIELAVRAMLAEPVLARLPERPWAGPRAAAIWFRTEIEPGELLSIAGPEPVAPVVAVEHLVHPGDRVRTARNSFERLAAARAVAADRPAALLAAREAAAAIDVQVKTEGTGSAE